MAVYEVQYNGGMVMRVNCDTEDQARQHVRSIETEIARKIGREPHVNISGVVQVKGPKAK